MTSKETVYRTIEFKNPPRVPINYFNRDIELSDTAVIGFAPARGFVQRMPGETEWGYVWTSLDDTMGQPHSAPLMETGSIDSYIPPDPRAPGRFDHLPDVIAANKDKFIKFGIGISGFNQATFLRGFENFLEDICADREMCERILDIVFDFENGLVEQLAGYDIDAVTFGDDWGTQQGLIISPAQWREVFKPRYAHQFELIHRQGKKVWFHTCGNVYSIIGDLIEVGVDVLELLQPDVMGIGNLSRDFGGKVCFCNSIDHQRVAISGSRQEIFDYAETLKRKLGSFNGGFIAYIEDYSSLGMSDQNYQWIKEAFNACAEY